MSNFLSKQLQRLIPWSVPVLLLLSWQLLVQTGIVPSRVLPAPTAVVQAGLNLAATGELWRNLYVSTARALIGFAIGGSLGFILGLLNGIFPFAEKLLDTSLQMLRNIPHLALIPLVILWFGIDEEAKIFLVSIGVLFPIYLNTYHGVHTVDQGLLEMGKVYGLKPFELFWQIILPSALPAILVGVRFSLGIMWLTLIVSETIAADSGIGYMAMNAREFLQTDVVVFSILLYALLGKLADILARLLEQWLLQWHPSYQSAQA
ncbi:aliphatic sulfonate ABC transporter permease SsuC [Leptolyngbya sp. FACHB-321]|uniref:aliphatic sulfonate ABC transporter permease SsuC n=1 Tax=Leptolyngbya sp. FACHB-321 TaxID=2692807 RepID=UPI0016896476|nr:aliphatic sulfonate ABC transporter permease SsuC [Leptolyngbya sp. FACHB-321]MBD2035863.1 aliphatic sulfonate ABC transporter permease SsuC [Leptolyngbya sp. FACHB-321]